MVPTLPQQSQAPGPALATVTKKPSWATGDPFFDTMAGMDTPEYHQYYHQLTSVSAAGSTTTDELLASSTAALLIDGSSAGDQQKPQHQESCGTSPSSSHQQGQGQGPPSDATTGLDHWNRTREEWTKGRWHVVPSANSQNPALNAIHPGNHDAIYDSLVYDRKRLSKPIPLPLVVSVSELIDGILRSKKENWEAWIGKKDLYRNENRTKTRRAMETEHAIPEQDIL
jgi:hypothetical protein